MALCMHYHICRLNVLTFTLMEPDAQIKHTRDVHTVIYIAKVTVGDCINTKELLAIQYD